MNSWVNWLPTLFLIITVSSYLIYGLIYEKPIPFGIHLITKQYTNLKTLTTLALIIIGWTSWLYWPFTRDTLLLHHLFQETPFLSNIQIIALLTVFIIILYTYQFNSSSSIKEYELISLILFAALGIVLIISANDLITIYLGIEIQSLSFYILTSYKRLSDSSTEAGLKYFLLGALSSGFILFGTSLYYGILGTTNLGQLQLLLNTQSLDTIYKSSLGLALVFIIAAFFFKLVVVPFHTWAPDIYQGAPTIITAFLATTPKISLWIIFSKLLFFTFQSWLSFWQPILLICAILSLLIAATTALNQSKIKRLIAYSSISNAGFLLAGLTLSTYSGLQTLVFYLVVYIIMLIGLFTVLLSLRGILEQRIPTSLNELTGLNRIEPTLTFSLAVILFSLAGIPPLAGFYSKLYLFNATIEATFYGLTTIAILTSVLAAYYYIRIIQYMYFKDTSEFHYQTQLWALDKQNHIDLPKSILLSCIILILIGLGLHTHSLDLITQNWIQQ